MAANIDAEIRDIQEASRGEQVRDAIVNALIAINDSGGSVTREMVTEIVNTIVNALDATSTGGDGKYIKSISETNGVIAASEETADTSPIKNSQKLITSDGVATAIETLQTNFQDGVDDVYDAVVAKGSTPASKSLSDVIDAINNIQGDSHHIIKHTDTWEQNYNMGPMVFDSPKYLWDDGDNLYYSRNSIQTIFDQNTLTFNNKTWNINVDVQGNAIAKIDDRIVYINSGIWYFYDKENSVFEPSICLSGSNIWTDGTDTYYSKGTTQKVFNKTLRTWNDKTWSGLTYLDGAYIWTDGTDIYYSYSTTQKVFNKTLRTWDDKTWSGLNNFYGGSVWTDGDNIYYSYTSSGSSINYVLDKSLGVWNSKAWNGMTSFSGSCIWSDGTDIYYSYGTTQKVLDKSTSTWNDKTWSGLTSVERSYIWTDGTDTYYSNGTTQKVLDKSTSTWNDVTWSGLESNTFEGIGVWTDGDNIYFSDDYRFLRIDVTNLKLGEIIFYTNYYSNSSENIWTDGTDTYYSKGATQKVFDKTLKVWHPKTWNGLTSFDGSNTWTDGTDIYYSYSTTQKVLDKSTSTWSDKTWSGVTSFSGNSIRNVNGNTYLQTGSDSCYILDKATSAWSRIYNWIPAPVTNVFYINGVYYTYNNDLYYKYNPTSNTWESINIWGPCSLTAVDIWYDEGNTYYSYGSAQYVLDTSDNVWKKKVWRGVTNITGRYIWTDGDNIYYSDGSAQYKLDKSTSTWSSCAWKGAITNLVGGNIWNDRKAIYHTDGVVSYKLGVVDE
jgi:hypothetical protein